eukprot:4492233-Pyramimonas_sp.AAC.1
MRQHRRPSQSRTPRVAPPSPTKIMSWVRPPLPTAPDIVTPRAGHRRSSSRWQVAPQECHYDIHQRGGRG